MKTTMSRTLDQKRAKKALEFVKSAIARSQSLPQDYLKELRSNAESLPTLIVTSGIGPALAFYWAKGGSAAEKPQTALAEAVSSWLCEEVFEIPVSGTSAIKTCLDKLVSNETDVWLYRMAETEALELATWLKRFCQAMIERPASESGAES